MSTPLFPSDDDALSWSKALATEQLGKPLHFLSRTTSTNDLALAAAKTGAPHGTLFVADWQDGGRGRRNRRWESPPEVGLLFSVLVRPAQIPTEYTGWIPLIAGLASAEGLAQATGFQAHLKWPNDIVVPRPTHPGWHKLGGILCESVLGPGGSLMVIGIGLNINHARAELPEGTRVPPTSIAVETGKTADRRAILAAVLLRLETHLLALGHESGRQTLRDTIQNNMAAWAPAPRRLAVEVPIEGSGNKVEGAFGGLDQFGRLVLTKCDGARVVLADAEITNTVG